MIIENYRATLIGCAVGDTLGMAVEGWKKEQIKKYAPRGRITQPIDPVLVKNDQGELIKEDEFGKLKYYTKDLKKGDWTDDTILTMAIAESIVECKNLNLENIAMKHLKAYNSCKLPDGKIKGGFGSTTMQGFMNLEMGISPLESGVIGGPGNGPAMKMHPIGMYMDSTGKYKEGLDFAEKIGRMTHLDPRSVASGILQAHAVYSLLQGITRVEFLDIIADVCKENEKPLTSEFTWHKSSNLLQRIKWINDNKNASIEEALLHLGNSSAVYQSYPFALFMFQKYWNENPIEGLLETVNTGGDCDTTGAIYGALCGAKNGMRFPRDWVDCLNDSENIIKTADKICLLKCHEEENDAI